MIVFKGIKPEKLKQDVFRLEFLTGINQMKKEIKADYAKTTETWEGDKPKFDAAASLRSPGPTLVVDASGGSEKGVKKWNWLDKGTKVRYATMSPDWRSKTKVKWIGSGTGRGRKLFVNKRKPRPGIKARKWTEEITKKFSPRFKRRMEQAMRDAARKSGHST